ncbi:Hypothetical predicted protein [Olea europaea subsp. europaea]|uniref:Uncharacterized protein n=1 Tax=Olea europaea subsp. europaea TaxID=158383 RepID=A0A8S0TLU3_OLEEU|nr:Hypothetical predicted protein [Olea europaea subsp. europaea]
MGGGPGRAARAPRCGLSPQLGPRPLRMLVGLRSLSLVRGPAWSVPLWISRAGPESPQSSSQLVAASHRRARARIVWRASVRPSSWRRFA